MDWITPPFKHITQIKLEELSQLLNTLQVVVLQVHFGSVDGPEGVVWVFSLVYHNMQCDFSAPLFMFKC